MSDHSELKVRNLKDRKKNRINAWIPFILWAGLIFAFSSIASTSTTEVYWQDFLIKKSAHMVEFFVFSLFLYRALRYEDKKTPGIFLLIIVVGTIYATLDEFHQSFTPGRQPSPRDVGFDSIGMCIGIYFLYRLDNLKLKYKQLQPLSVYLNHEQ